MSFESDSFRSLKLVTFKITVVHYIRRTYSLFLEFTSADFPDTWDECKETEELNCKAGLWETCCPADDWCIPENDSGDPIR